MREDKEEFFGKCIEEKRLKREKKTEKSKSSISFTHLSMLILFFQTLILNSFNILALSRIEMWKILHQTIPMSQVILALISGIFGSIIGAYIASVPAYQQIQAQRDQIKIMRQSLEREVNLIMTVVPFCAWTQTSNGTTVKIENTTLALSKTKEFYFTIYVSNVGDAFAHLLYYSVTLHFDSKSPISNFFGTETIVLKPQESMSFEYTFDPSNIPSEKLSDAQYLTLLFIVGSAETTIQKVIPTQIS